MSQCHDDYESPASLSDEVEAIDADAGRADQCHDVYEYPIADPGELARLAPRGSGQND